MHQKQSGLSPLQFQCGISDFHLGAQKIFLYTFSSDTSFVGWSSTVSLCCFLFTGWWGGFDWEDPATSFGGPLFPEHPFPWRREQPVGHTPHTRSGWPFTLCMWELKMEYFNSTWSDGLWGVQRSGPWCISWSISWLVVCVSQFVQWCKQSLPFTWEG